MINNPKLSSTLKLLLVMKKILTLTYLAEFSVWPWPTFCPRLDPIHPPHPVWSSGDAGPWGKGEGQVVRLWGSAPVFLQQLVDFLLGDLLCPLPLGLTHQTRQLEGHCVHVPRGPLLAILELASLAGKHTPQSSPHLSVHSIRLRHTRCSSLWQKSRDKKRWPLHLLVGQRSTRIVLTGLTPQQGTMYVTCKT